MTDPLVQRLSRAGCVYAEDEAAVLRDRADDDHHLDLLVARRVQGEPLEVVVGWAQFAGLRILLDADVFVPRRRTELVARTAIELLGGPRRGSGTPVVVDLCCGSGAVAAAITSAYSDLEVHAVDIDPRAVACARRNLTTSAQVHEGDLEAALPTRLLGAIDLITANAPYVPTDEISLMPRESREHEPVRTVDGGHDGVAVHRRISRVAARWLAPGGALVMESSDASLDRTHDAVVDAGLTMRVVTDDDLESLVVVATR